MNKPVAAAAEQNKAPIANALQTILRSGDLVLELGSGTGQHACHFAREFPDISWQPTELGALLPVIDLWIRDEGSDNILRPIELDASLQYWPVESADVVYTANTLHIVSAATIERMFLGAGSVLHAEGRFCAYGPFMLNGEHTADSNAEFDRALKQNDPASGVRDMVWLDSLAVANGMQAAELVPMPANNFLAVWRRAALH